MISSGPGPFVAGSPLQLPVPALHFWFRCTSEKPGSMQNDFKFILADKNGVMGGQGTGGWSAYGQGRDKWLTFGIPIEPRRSKTLQLYLFQAADPTHGPYRQIATVQFPNPLFDNFPNWTPEPVPATKMAGDLRLTFSDFAVATENRWNEIAWINGKQTRFHQPGSGEDRKIIFKLDIDSPRGTNEAWMIATADLSDGTGNHIHNDSVSRWSITDEYYMGPALWPDESAWRLAFQLKKFRGYDSQEIVTFTNVPVPGVGGTYIVFQTNSIHGVKVILKQEFTRKPDKDFIFPLSPGYTHATVELVNHPKDFVVDFVALNADTGWKATEWSNRRTTDSHTVYLSSMPANVLTLNVTWAVQQQRTVEFMVKPPPMK